MLAFRLSDTAVIKCKLFSILDILEGVHAYVVFSVRDCRDCSAVGIARMRKSAREVALFYWIYDHQIVALFIIGVGFQINIIELRNEVLHFFLVN